MLVLTRKPGERIIIDKDIVIEVLEVQGNRLRISIEAPRGIQILRAELLEGEANHSGRKEEAADRLAAVS